MQSGTITTSEFAAEITNSFPPPILLAFGRLFDIQTCGTFSFQNCAYFDRPAVGVVSAARPVALACSMETL
jgi:hypothetical protein